MGLEINNDKITGRETNPGQAGDIRRTFVELSALIFCTTLGSNGSGGNIYKLFSQDMENASTTEAEGSGSRDAKVGNLNVRRDANKSMAGVKGRTDRMEEKVFSLI